MMRSTLFKVPKVPFLSAKNSVKLRSKVLEFNSRGVPIHESNKVP